jgi:hypothetical protein
MPPRQLFPAAPAFPRPLAQARGIDVILFLTSRRRRAWIIFSIIAASCTPKP